MKKISLSIICIVAVLIMCVGAMCACNENNGCAYELVFSERSGFGAFKQTDSGYQSFSKTKIISVENLHSICDEWDAGTFDENSTAYNSTLNAKLREYDDTFFEDKALMLFMTWACGSAKIDIKSVQASNDTVTVNTQITTPSRFYFDDAVSYVLLIEISNEYVNENTQLVIV